MHDDRLRLRGGGHEADQRTAHRYLHRVRGGAVEGQAVDHSADDDAAADGRPLAVILTGCLFQLKSGRTSAPRILERTNVGVPFGDTPRVAPVPRFGQPRWHLPPERTSDALTGNVR